MGNQRTRCASIHPSITFERIQSGAALFHSKKLKFKRELKKIKRKKQSPYYLPSSLPARLGSALAPNFDQRRRTGFTRPIRERDSRKRHTLFFALLFLLRLHDSFIHSFIIDTRGRREDKGLICCRPLLVYK